jgi:pyruvate/2-oxoglutarate dehydrogenase complex dihydrolipoamide acyltransferase (E2) component
MIKFAGGLAACGALLFSVGFALADAPPQGSPAAPAAQAPAPRPAPPAVQPKRPAEARVTAATPECTWSGKRIVSLLIRDDVDTADKHRRFYEQFGCPAQHVGLALRCVIQSEIPAAAPTQGSVQQGQAHAKALAERVEQCWDKPSVKFLNR